MINLKNVAAAVVAYANYRVTGDRATYAGPAHTDVHSDKLVLTSTAPKRNGVNLGNRRSSANLATTTTVDDANGVSTVRDRKMEILVSLPVGVTLADLKEDAARIIEFLSNDTLIENFFIKGQIEL